MNNFVFSQDPLLYSSLEVRQVPQQNEYEMRRQFDDAMTRYQAYSQQGPPPPPPTRDYIGELDSLVSGLDEDLNLTLTADVEYMKLNEDLQKIIQAEIMKSVKWKINGSPEAVAKMDRMKELIATAKRVKEDESRRMMTDLNDYVKNYSDLTFEEYKQLKYGKKD